MSSIKRVLVTGATSGMGRAMAVQLARRGWRVAMTGRRAAKLEAAVAAVRAAGGEPLPLLGSVTEIETVREHYARIRRQWGGLDWAILNAGVGDSKGALEFSAENYRWTLATNVGGVVNWMEVVLPDMIAAGSGTIAGISSLAAFRGLPKSGPYCASKAALLALLESVRLDLRGTGVKIVTICPGFVRSELTDRNDARDMRFILDTEDGARRILRGVERGQRLVHFPWQISWPMVHIARHLPGWLYDRFIGTFAKKHPKKPYIDESAKRR